MLAMGIDMPIANWKDDSVIKPKEVVCAYCMCATAADRYKTCEDVECRENDLIYVLLCIILKGWTMPIQRRLRRCWGSSV